MAKKYSPIGYIRRKIESDRVAARDELKAVGFMVSELLADGISQKALREITDRLVELEREYDVSEYRKGEGVDIDYGTLFSESGFPLSGSVAAQTESYLGDMVQTITFNSKNSYERLNSAIESMRTKGDTVPYDPKTTTPWQYIATHEYGHALQHAILTRQGIDTRYRRSNAVANHRSKIIKYAEGHNGGKSVSEQMSKYGATSPDEFFAEAFTNAHSGAPNAIGKGMMDFLADMRKQGYLK